jgi:hypothetical protein
VRKYLLLVAVAAISTPQIAWAERSSDAAWLDLGAFRAQINSHLRLGNEKLGIEGTDVDFEKDLGLQDKRWMPKATAGIRFLKRFRFEADHFRLTRDNKFVISKNITIDDTTFPLSADIDTHFKTDIYRVALGYSFIRRDNAELGVAVGAHVSSADFRIAALNSALEEHRSKSAPLPNVGVYGSVGLWGPVTLQGNVDAFKLKVGNFKGSLIDGQLAVNYRFMKNVGAGLGYRYAHYKISAHTNNWDGTLWYNYSGPMAFIELAL